MKHAWKIVIDTREQCPYNFEYMSIGSGKSRRDVEILTVAHKLKCGDYSIEGFEDRIAIERKSPSDLYSTLSRGRERFIRELALLNQLEFAAVIVESEWAQLLTDPPDRSRLNPVSVDGMILAFMIRFPKVHWVFRPGRFASSKTVYKILSRFWEDNSSEQ